VLSYIGHDLVPNVLNTSKSNNTKVEHLLRFD